MARIYPFRALRYSPAKVPIEKVVTQPYDKISPEMQERYYQLDPYNLVRIIRGKSSPGDGPDNNVYTRAQADLQDWRQRGILEQLETPALFVYFQRFAIPGSGETKTRKGFIGLGRLEDYSNKVVFPHERTLTGPKQDRLELLRQTRTHFGQVFMVYSDPRERIDNLLEKISERSPDLHAEDEYGAVHTLWTITDPEIISAIQRQMEGKKLIIADGHHRYETALAFRDEMRSKRAAGTEASYEKLMMTFINMDSTGLTILPAHRLVSALPQFDVEVLIRRASDYFDIMEMPYQNFAERCLRIENLGAGLKNRGEKSPAIGAYARGRPSFFLLSLKAGLNLGSAMPDVSERQRQLDVVVLHRLLLEKCFGISEEDIRRETYVSYVREMDAGIQAVEDGRSQVCFFLNATRIDQVRDIAFAGEVLPQKSTDFYPKLLSGLTMYCLEG